MERDQALSFLGKEVAEPIKPEVVTGPSELDFLNEPETTGYWQKWVKPVTRPFKAQAYKAAEALNRGTGSFAQNLDEMSKHTGEITGMEPGGAFERGTKFYLENAEYWRKKAEDTNPTFVDEMIGEAVGGAAPGIAEFMLNVPYAALIGAMEAHKKGDNELLGAFTGAGKRFALGRIFHALGILPKPAAAPAMGGVFAAQAAAEGASREEVAKSFGIGMLYGITTPTRAKIPKIKIPKEVIPKEPPYPRLPPERPPEVTKKAPRIEEVTKEVGKLTPEQVAAAEARMAAAMERGEAKAKAEAPPLKKEPGGIPNFTERAKASRTEPTPEAYKWAKDATKEQYETLKKARDQAGKQHDINVEEAKTMPKGPERQAKVTEIDFNELSFKGEAIEAYEIIHGLRRRDAFKVDQIEKTLGIKLPEVKAKEVKPAVVKGATEAQKAQAHILAKEKGWISIKGKPKPQYRRLAKAFTDKTSIAKMTEAEADAFIGALEKVPKTEYVAGKMKIASIPITQKITPKGFFEKQFREPTMIEKITPSDRYAYTLGVHDIIEPSIKAKTAMLNERKIVFDWLDKKGKEINKLGKTSFLEKKKARLKNVPTKAEQRIWELLDKHETVEATGLKGEEARLFTELRKLTNDMLERTNEVRKGVGLEPINKLSAYVTHISDVLTKKGLLEKYPFPEDIRYWMDWIQPKHIFNPTALRRMVETRPGLSKNPIKALKAMTSMDLKQIYLEAPTILFREQMNALKEAIPASTRQWAQAYINEVIKGYPTKLDNLTNSSLNKLGIVKAVDAILKPIGRTSAPNFVKGITGQLGRIVHDATIWGKLRLVLRNHTQKFLSLGLYDSKAFAKSFLPSSKELKNLIKTNDFWKISQQQYMERLPEGMVGKLEKLGFKPYGHSHISNVSSTMRTAYYAAKELAENPKYKKYGWTEKDIAKEMEFGAHTAQYWYNAMGMPSLYRSGITRLAGTLQSWWMNYTTNFWREMLHRTWFGKTGWGKPIPPKWRIGALRHIVTSILFVEGMRQGFGLDYKRIALLGVLPTYLSPPGQVAIGLVNLITATNDWQRKKAIRRLKYSYKAFVPGSGAWRDFMGVWKGEIGLKGLLFYPTKEEKEKLTLKKAYQTIQ